jgi:DNA end-binding protein Ku
MRTKEYLAALRPDDGYLVLETLFYADEIRDPVEVIGPIDDVEVEERELRIARQLIESMASEWDPTRYADTYRERVLDLIERKAEGEAIVVEETETPAPVLDLMAALEQSLASARREDGRSAHRDGARSSSGSRGEREARRAEPGKSRADGDGAGAGDYGSWSRRRLEDEARKREIPGRSKMKRQELVEALQQAS